MRRLRVSRQQKWCWNIIRLLFSRRYFLRLKDTSAKAEQSPARWARSAVTALATRRHPIWPEIAEFGTTKDHLWPSLF
ncbi:hypothetical protein EFP44_11785 [Lacticaseibacillus paracasei]|nr:hypothetical protein [Lacticaseibacillus paracasei]